MAAAITPARKAPHKSSGRKMLPVTGRVFLSGARHDATHSAIPDAAFSRFVVTTIVGMGVPENFAIVSP